MSIPKSNRATLFFLLATFSIASFKLSYCIENYNSINFCPEIEKQSLLSFKQSLKAPSNKLSSWNNGEVNCCKWKGVVCHNYTGHVHQLHLQHCELRGRISSSLLNLKHLRYLDLSRNYFEETIPSFIGLFPSLEFLNLSNSGFYGIIPRTIGNLSNLRTLSLESYHTSINVDSLEWLSGLSLLEHLNMNYVNLSRATTNWIQVINTLSFLVELRFRFCSLNFVAPMNVVNVSSLAILDLSGNEFLSFVVPNLIFSELTYLDLSRNALEGPIPSISNTTKLQYIDLSFNYLNSTIPDWLYFCKDLEIVYLKRSFLDGTISNAIANLSSLNTLDLSWNEFSGKIPREITNLCKMKELRLSANMFGEELLDSFGNMSDCFLGTLKILDLGSNKLSGHVPNQFGEFKRLRYLNLGGNKLTENLPKSLGQLFDLEFLTISKNMLEGEVTESHFVNLSKLKYFYATGNHLSLKVNPNWIPPFKLVGLGLGSWNLGVSTQILSWLETQKKSIVALDLSSTRISGHVPNWFWKIQVLNLSHNHLHGKIPDINGPEEDDRMIYLSSNQFSGSLPRVANSVTELDLSNNSFSGGIFHFLCDMTNETHRLKILHLGKNKLTGELSDCWMKWPSLRVLNLENNMMFGSIPNSIGFLADLLSLNMKNNKFSGPIPSSILNCTKLVKIDLSDNNLDGNIPAWMGKSLAKLRFLILRSNNLGGKISSEICYLNSLQILDLSNNNFSGIIPKCFHNFIAMATKRSTRTLGEYHLSREMDYSAYTGAFLESASISTKGSEYQYDTILSLVTNINLSNNNFSGEIPKELTSLVELQSLNMSGNHLKGSIPDRIGDMKQLESLDFSRNSLSGEIPNSFTAMSSLNHLNLSYNKLTGRIPESTQILGFDASSFIGNNLCGPPLTSNCSNDNEVSGVQLNKEDNEGNKFEIDWFDIFLSLGYAVGFSVVCTMLVFKKSWRDAYFGMLEDLWNKAYVYFYIKWRRFAEY